MDQLYSTQDKHEQLISISNTRKRKEGRATPKKLPRHRKGRADTSINLKKSEGTTTTRCDFEKIINLLMFGIYSISIFIYKKLNKY
jgi:hypothetical protein